jgi:hypothetical protein
MPRVQATPAAIQDYLGQLESVPSIIATCTAGRDEAQLGWSPDPRTWSAVDILAHMRGCADLWTHSIYAMLVDEAPALPLLDERRWAKVTQYNTLDFATSFQAFTLQRSNLVHVLRSLPPESWARSATIGGRNLTVFSQARRMVLHELEHCHQLEALFAGS